MGLLTLVLCGDDDRMPNINQDLVGKKFGHLTVIAKSTERGKQNQYIWLCQCDCGRQILATTSLPNSGQIVSCGHVRLERSKKNLRFTEARHQKQLNNRPPRTSKTGYRNISMTLRSGRWRYRVSIQYDHKQHSALVDTLGEALAERERLRSEWWPGYKSNTDMV